MYINQTAYADEALQRGLELAIARGIETPSRNGPVLRLPAPLTTTYRDPRSRVLFNPVRDCNPFLHLFESMWMLAGRNDLKFVQFITPSMANFSDDGVTLNGAYGYRWRRHFCFDQLDDYIVHELDKDKTTRRAYMGMWDPAEDPTSAQKGSKDVPCNLGISFDVVEDHLQMTVFNRSNDLVWGAYGANLVHMSFLQEYVANSIGLEVGNYYQVSNNAHIYTQNPVTKRLIEKDGDAYTLTPQYIESLGGVRLWAGASLPLGMPATPNLFDRQSKSQFMTDLDSLFFRFDTTGRIDGVEYQSEFGQQILAPLAGAYMAYKDDDLVRAQHILLSHYPRDWVVNAGQWIQRRINSRKQKEQANG